MKIKIQRAIFLTWFIGSIIAILCISLFISNFDNRIGWFLCLFGQYFVVLGVIAIWDMKNDKPFQSIVLMAPLVGIVCCSCGIYILLYGEVAMNKMSELAPYLLYLSVLIAGILFMHTTLSELVYLKKKCTYEVDAKCVDIMTSYTEGRRRVYMPIYNILINGQEHIICNEKYSNIKFEIGKYYKILIDPENINNFFDLNTKYDLTGSLIFELVFIIASIGTGLLIF